MIRSRPVAARATRTALIVASVPELTKRTRSTDGTRRQTSRPSSTSCAVGAPKLVPRPAAPRRARVSSGGACPWMSGPHDMT